MRSVTPRSRTKTVTGTGMFYKMVLWITVVWSYTMIIVYLSVGVLLFNKTGTILADAFFTTYNGYLSPFAPVWNDVGENPFGRYFWNSSIYCFIMMSLYVVLLGLCIRIACLSMSNSKDTLMLLTVISTYLSTFKFLSAIFSDWYIVLLFTNNKWMLVQLLNVSYEIVSTDPVPNAFNMVMLMGKCCGVDGPGDFKPVSVTVDPGMNPYGRSKYMDVERLPMWPSTARHITFRVPAACCDPETYHDLFLLEDCVGVSLFTPHRGKGCIQAYIEIFEKYIGRINFKKDLTAAILLLWVAAMSATKIYKKRKNSRQELCSRNEETDELSSPPAEIEDSSQVNKSDITKSTSQVTV